MIKNPVAVVLALKCEIREEGGLFIAEIPVFGVCAQGPDEATARSRSIRTVEDMVHLLQEKGGVLIQITSCNHAMFTDGCDICGPAVKAR